MLLLGLECVAGVMVVGYGDCIGQWASNSTFLVALRRIDENRMANNFSVRFAHFSRNYHNNCPSHVFL